MAQPQEHLLFSLDPSIPSEDSEVVPVAPVPRNAMPLRAPSYRHMHTHKHNKYLLNV